MKIAIVGSGAAGLGAAWALAQKHSVTIFESDLRAGGHAHTAMVERNGSVINVDTGFVIFNEYNYPNLNSLFESLGVESNPADMSVSVTGDIEIEWTSNFHKYLSWNQFSKFDIRIIPLGAEILKFNNKAKKDLAEGKIQGGNIQEYIRELGCSRRFFNCYLAPIAAAIWSIPSEAVGSFPAKAFLDFFHSHSLLNIIRSPWRVVSGGSINYVEKLISSTPAELRLGEAVLAVRRDENYVSIQTTKAGWQEYDHVVFACHADDALLLLEKPTAEERSVLGAIPYATNKVFLHSDTALMPQSKIHWASWNCMADRERAAEGKLNYAVTYNMNLLQGIDPQIPMFVTLRAAICPKDECIYGEYDYKHPVFTKSVLAAQSRVRGIQMKNKTCFAGSYLGAGFHEDAFGSGLLAAELIGAEPRLT